MSARAESRYTGDVDVAVAVDGDAGAERLAFVLQGLGYEILAQIENEAVDRLGTLRMSPPPGARSGLIVDLLFATAGIEGEAARTASPVDVMPRLTIPVASRASLIAFKLVSESVRRTQDAGDLIALIRASDEADLEAARELASLSMDRGFNRERDLLASLDGFIALAAQD